MTRSGKRYYMSFIDDYSRYSKLYLLSHKDEASETFLKYKAEVKNQLNRKIKRFRSDRGGEYDSNTLNAFCKEYGIIHKVTPPYSPESNGVAEKKNRTLKEMMNTMLISFGHALNLWGEAILLTCHIQNRTPFKKIGKILYKLWTSYLLNISYLKVWVVLLKS